jgi:hypothetical protein
MKRLVPFSAVTFLLLVVTILDGSASSLPISNEELILESRDIVHGIVKELKSEWAENNSMIYTQAKLQILDVYKGEPRDEIIILIPGGTIKSNNQDTLDSAKNKAGVDNTEHFHFRGGGGDISLVVSDEAELELGMEVIIHTYVTIDGRLVIHSGERGAYIVKNGVIERMNMTPDQYKNFVDEVMKKK